jgi:hypothetical protein
MRGGRGNRPEIRAWESLGSLCKSYQRCGSILRLIDVSQGGRLRLGASRLVSQVRVALTSHLDCAATRPGPRWRMARHPIQVLDDGLRCDPPGLPCSPLGLCQADSLPARLAPGWQVALRPIRILEIMTNRVIYCRVWISGCRFLQFLDSPRTEAFCIGVSLHVRGPAMYRQHV